MNRSPTEHIGQLPFNRGEKKPVSRIYVRFLRNRSFAFLPCVLKRGCKYVSDKAANEVGVVSRTLFLPSIRDTSAIFTAARSPGHFCRPGLSNLWKNRLHSLEHEAGNSFRESILANSENVICIYASSANVRVSARRDTRPLSSGPRTVQFAPGILTYRLPPRSTK